MIHDPSGAAALAEVVSRELGASLLFTVAREPSPVDALTSGERERFASFTTEARRTEWRLGRAALKAALRALGESEDTTCLELPHARLSLTHSGTVAVAAASQDMDIDGVGVDLEIERMPRPGTARFFLCDRELAWLEAQPEAARAAHLLRLWTIKEAVFKADRGNAITTLRDYRLADPSLSCGAAYRETDADPIVFAYITVTAPGGFEGASLSVAVHRGRTSQ